MKKQTILQENIFLTLAKMFAALQIDKKVGDAMKELPNDPEVKEAMNTMKKSAENTIKLLKDYCKRNPEDEKCKDSQRDK